MGDGIGAAGVIFGIICIVVVVIGAVLLANPMGANRDNAAAARAQSEAFAYQVRTQADTEAAAERANVRQMERDASHQRAIDTLPFVVVTVGGAVVALVVVVLLWDVMRQRQPTPTADPGLMFYLQERDREMWRALAQIDRRALSDNRDVVIYSERGQK